MESEGSIYIYTYKGMYINEHVKKRNARTLPREDECFCFVNATATNNSFTVISSFFGLSFFVTFLTVYV